MHKSFHWKGKGTEEPGTGDSPRDLGGGHGPRGTALAAESPGNPGRGGAAGGRVVHLEGHRKRSQEDQQLPFHKHLPWTPLVPPSGSSKVGEGTPILHMGKLRPKKLSLTPGHAGRGVRARTHATGFNLFLQTLRARPK